MNKNDWNLNKFSLLWNQFPAEIDIQWDTIYFVHTDFTESTKFLLKFGIFSVKFQNVFYDGNKMVGESKVVKFKTLTFLIGEVRKNF